MLIDQSPVAQLAELAPHKGYVGGSSPSRGTTQGGAGGPV